MRMVTDIILEVTSENYEDEQNRSAEELNELITEKRLEHMKQVFAEALLSVLDDAEKLEILSFNIVFKDDIIIPESFKKNKEDEE